MSHLSSLSNDNIVLSSAAESQEKVEASQTHMVTSPITGEVRPAAKVPTAEEIVDQLQRHMPDADLDMVRRAYDYASAAHAGQLRLSGDPYIMHPATVAYTLAEMGFDEHSVVLSTSLGTLVIHGQNLQLKNLSLEGGQVAVEGTLSAFIYEQPRKRRFFG